ncbi:MAG: serine protease AprX [Actinomycetota bacterium]|nr:serine protease AprX [Actinomycetota bacterium]
MLRRRSIAAAALAALTMVGITGAHALTGPQPAKPGPRVEGSLAAQLAKAKPGATIGAFVNVVHGASPASVLAAHGLKLTQDFSDVDAAFAVGTAAQFKALQHDGAVSYIEPNRTYKMFDNSRYATRVEALQSPVYGGRYRDASNQILTGKGIGVAEIDSGIDGTHPDLKNHVVKNFKVVCATPVLVNSSGDKADQCYQVTFQETQDSDTSSGHGTHVAGIVAGDGSASNGYFKGVAPEAGLYGFGTGEGDSIITQQAVSSFQWVIDNWDKVTPNIRVITNSWGCPGGCAFDPSSLVTKLVDKAVSKGITVLFAAGNDGGSDAVTGDSLNEGSNDTMSGDAKNPTPGVIAVANYDDLTYGARDSVLDSSSSRGLASDATTWPDVAAPGSFITSTCNHATPICSTGPAPAWSPYYASLSGTSMATPHVAGIVALILQQNPLLTPAQVESLIQATAHKIPVVAANPGAYVDDPQNPGSTSSFDKGAGLADVQAAIDALGGDHANSFSISPLSIAIDSPSAGTEVSGPTTFTGTADTTEASRQIISGDAGDYNGPGAADISGLTVGEEPTGVRYTIGVRNVSDTGSPNTNVTLRINQNVNGNEAWTNVLVAPGAHATASAASTTNQAPATDVHVDATNNTVDFLVPYSAYVGGAGHSLAHNAVVTSLIGTIADVAPGGLGATYLSNPQQAAPYGFHYSTTGEAPAVSLTVNGGPDLPATVSGSGTSWTWSGDIDFSSKPAGTYTVRAKLYLDGVHRENVIRTVVVPETVDVTAPDAPVILTPSSGSLNAYRPILGGTAEVGSSVRVLEDANLVATATTGTDGRWFTAANMTEGLHTVTATATDAAGNVSLASAPVTFDVDAAGVYVTISQPKTNSVFLPGDALTISGAATDNRQVSSVVVKLYDVTNKQVFNGTATCTGCGTPSATWTISGPTNLLPGTYTIKASGYDQAGNVRSASATIVQI